MNRIPKSEIRANLSQNLQSTLPSQNTKALIFDVQRFSLHDGPGIRTTVFFKGCPLKCIWCHNPESWGSGSELSFSDKLCIGCKACMESCERRAISFNEGTPVTDIQKCRICGTCVENCPTKAREVVGEYRSVEALMAEIERDRPFYDESGGGVTFSGGEPLMQIEPLENLLQICSQKGIHTAVDTSCYASWETIDSISPHVDLFLCDLKHMNSQLHEKYTGVPNERVLENLSRLDKQGKEVVVRLPVIPGVNDDDANIDETKKFLLSLEALRRVDILPYNIAVQGKITRFVRDYQVWEGKAPDEDRIKTIAGTFEKDGFSVKVGG